MNRIPTALTRAAFSLMEAMGALFLVSLVVAGAITSYFFVTRAERRHSIKAELDLQSRALTERMRRDMWLSSRALIQLYPPGPGPYTAVGFPVLRKTPDDELVLPDEEGQIEWNAMVVYHLFEDKSQEVRRTLFFPQTGGTDEERMQQIEAVVRDGTGQNTLNSANATTRTMVRNLIEWRLDVIGARFDGYSEVPGRRDASFGAAMLTPGFHSFTYRILEKNNSSRGYRVSADTLIASPSGLPREAEAQLPVTGLSGPPPVADYRADGIWSANYLLTFPANGSGQQFILQMENDRWEERNFRHTGAVMEDSVVNFDTSVTPHGYMVQLLGNGVAWDVTAQLPGAVGSVPQDSSLAGSSMRVVLRGSDLADGGWISFNGTNVWARFRAGGTEDSRLHLRDAFIAEASPSNPANYVAGTRQSFTFGGDSSCTVVQTVETDPAPYYIQKDKSYVVGFLIQQSGTASPQGYAYRWSPQAANTGISSYRIPNAANADHTSAVWSGRPDVIASPDVYGLSSLRAGFAPVGTYVSQIVDTHVENTSFLEFNWIASVPQSAGLEMKVRAGNDPELADAPDWNAVSAAVSGLAPKAQGRYVQVQASLRPDSSALQGPSLRNFILRWPGETRMVDLGGSFETGPDCGIVELLVDGTQLIQGVTVDLTVFTNARMGPGATTRLTSSTYTEMSPRNTGR